MKWTFLVLCGLGLLIALAAGVLLAVQFVLIFYGMQLGDVTIWGFQTFRRVTAIGVAVAVVIGLAVAGSLAAWRWIKSKIETIKRITGQ